MHLLQHPPKDVVSFSYIKTVKRIILNFPNSYTMSKSRYVSHLQHNALLNQIFHKSICDEMIRNAF